MSEKVVGINQPYYLPYVGVFDRAAACDLYVINEYSALNRERANHRRTRIMQIHPTAPQDFIFLTQQIPKQYEGVPFDEVPTSAQFWEVQKQHAQVIYGTYKGAKHFGYMDGLLPLLSDHAAATLGEHNTRLIMFIAEKFGIGHKVRPIRELPVDRDELMQKTYEMTAATYANVTVCRRVEATHHIAGQNAPLWLDEGVFADNGVSVTYQKVDLQPYPQFTRRGHFVAGLSSIDLLFNNGPQSGDLLGKSSRVVDKQTLLATTELTGR